MRGLRAPSRLIDYSTTRAFDLCSLRRFSPRNPFKYEERVVGVSLYMAEARLALLVKMRRFASFCDLKERIVLQANNIHFDISQ